MAKATICDMKICAAVIRNGELSYRVCINNKLYDFCQKCFDGLEAFLKNHCTPSGEVQNNTYGAYESIQKMMEDLGKNSKPLPFVPDYPTYKPFPWIPSTIKPEQYTDIKWTVGSTNNLVVPPVKYTTGYTSNMKTSDYTVMSETEKKLWETEYKLWAEMLSMQ